MSAARVTHFVVGVCGEMPGRQPLEIAAEMARYFSAQFSVLMIEDAASGVMGSLPFAREYIPGRSTWQTIEVADVQARNALAQRRAREAFADVARLHGLSADFEVMKGDGQEELARVLRNYDVVAMVAPTSAGAWMTLPFSAFAEAALHGPAIALLLPARIFRRKGPVVALASATDQDSLMLGARLAQATGEMLVVLAADAKDIAQNVQSVAARVDLPSARLRIIDADGSNLHDINRLLGVAGARILVARREYLTQPGLGQLIGLAAAHGIAIFIPGKPVPSQDA